jgi:glycogen synthase
MLHIGKEIKKIVEKKGWSIAHFAKTASMSYRNTLYLFERTDVSIDQLVHISKILEYDFMKLYSIQSEINSSPDIDTAIPSDFTTMTFSLTIGGRTSEFEKFPELMKKTRILAESLGFKVM